MVFPFEKFLTFIILTVNKYSWRIICHNCTWLLNNSPVNLIGNMLIDFLKNVMSTGSFSVFCVQQMLFLICRLSPVFTKEINVFKGNY